MVKGKFKSGAASFYIVAFSTLILVIIAASFASAIIAEITRSSNSDLAQSAYDAALAGVEDAKAAFINYQNCLAKGATADYKPSGDVTCGDIIYWMERAQEDGVQDCDMVGHILGRIPKDGSGEVQVAETTNNETNNNMQQAYTCVTIRTKLYDYKTDLNAKNPYRIIKIKLEENNHAKNIGAARISWYSNKESDEGYEYNSTQGKNVAFRSLEQIDKPTVPPVIGLQVIQTAGDTIDLNVLNSKTVNGKTDRVMAYLVPTEKREGMCGDGSNCIMTYNSDKEENRITSAQMASTNDHSKDYPFLVYCDPDRVDAYGCSVTIDLPEPIGGDRSDETFVFVASLPYGVGQNSVGADFSLELICKDGSSCGTVDVEGDVVGGAVAKLDKMQVDIDSTGRANDLFRRLDIRMEPGEDAINFPLYAVQVDNNFEKTLMATKEYSNYSGYTNW